MAELDKLIRAAMTNISLLIEEDLAKHQVDRDQFMHLVRRHAEIIRARALASDARIATLDQQMEIIEQAMKNLLLTAALRQNTWPKAAAPASRKVYEGILWCDMDDGWVLKGEMPADTKVIRDMFGRGSFVEGRQVRITIEALRKIKKCPSCGHAQPNGPETTSGKCLDCDRTSPSTGAHLEGGRKIFGLR